MLMSARSFSVPTSRLQAVPPLNGALASPRVHRDLGAWLCTRPRRTPSPVLAGRDRGRSRRSAPPPPLRCSTATGRPGRT